MVRRCVFGCTSSRTLFTFPTDPWLRKRWLEFAHLEESGIRSSSRICDRHFPDDSFNNLGLFNARITSYLRLIENAVPSLYTVGAPASVTVSQQPVLSNSGVFETWLAVGFICVRYVSAIVQEYRLPVRENAKHRQCERSSQYLENLQTK
ncbi:hypothetical protein C0J50_0741 [Silurus asotus]|uniref:THAP domain-containing protein 1 n=1 Tax=Silurus asotus TaxID=30991 RepID=A0AAD5FDL6_SILAS|nr:hypothetical protein C0J50_0741 [Silurus asotus]